MFETRLGRCKVNVVAKPVSDSEIRIEVWLPPAQAANGKFVGTGSSDDAAQFVCTRPLP